MKRLNANNAALSTFRVGRQQPFNWKRGPERSHCCGAGLAESLLNDARATRQVHGGGTQGSAGCFALSPALLPSRCLSRTGTAAAATRYNGSRHFLVLKGSLQFLNRCAVPRGYACARTQGSQFLNRCAVPYYSHAGALRSHSTNLKWWRHRRACFPCVFVQSAKSVGCFSSSLRLKELLKYHSQKYSRLEGFENSS